MQEGWGSTLFSSLILNNVNRNSGRYTSHPRQKLTLLELCYGVNFIERYKNFGVLCTLTMKNISSQFAGKYVAFVNEEIIASGKTTLEVYRKAKQLFPQKMVSLMYVPTKKEMVTFL